MDKLDRRSRKLLFQLCREKQMPRHKVAAILFYTDFSQPNANLSQLIAKGYIKTKKTGSPDGEGGLRDETVVVVYSITNAGKAAIENYRRKLIKWGIGTGVAIVGSIAALLTVLLGIL